MSYIEGRKPWAEGATHREDGTSTVEGFIHRIRDMGGFSFPRCPDRPFAGAMRAGRVGEGKVRSVA